MMALMKDKQDLSKFWRTKKKDSNNEASKLINITIFLFLLCVCVCVNKKDRNDAWTGIKRSTKTNTEYII